MNTPKAAPVAVEAAERRLNSAIARLRKGVAFWSEITDAIEELKNTIRAELASPLVAPVGGGIQGKIDEVREILEETYSFTTTPPRSQQNINAALALLEEIEAANRPQEVVRAEPVTDEDIESIRQALQTGLVHNGTYAALSRIAAARTAPAGTVPHDLAAHALEELAQLGYVVKGGMLYPPENLAELARVAKHPLATQAPSNADGKDAARWENMRARTLLAHLWRKYDAGGISMGRSHESVVLEAVLDLLGDPDHDDMAKLDADAGTFIDDTRTYLSGKMAKRMGLHTAAILSSTSAVSGGSGS